MKQIIIPIIFLIVQLMQVSSAKASELWLESSRGMGMGGRSFSILFGDFPHHQRGIKAIKNTHIILKDYNSKIKELKIRHSRHGFCVKVPAIFNGNYTLVAYKTVKTDNGTIHYYAKINFYVRHQKEAKTTNPNDDLKPFGKVLALELIRARNRGAEPFFISRTGHNIIFRVYFNSKPVSGVKITVITKNGWKKSLVSDKNGYVKFTAIQDRFPAKKYRWKPELFLVRAELDKNRDKYVSSYPVYTYIAPDAWRNKTAGVVILLLTMLAAGIWIYFKRRGSRY